MITLIKTRYSGPTNTRGARVVVTVIDTAVMRRIVRTVAYDDAIGARANHVTAMEATLATLPLIGGSVWLFADDGKEGYFFVPDRAANRITVSQG